MNVVKYGYELIPISQIVARTKVRLQLRDITDYDAEIEMFINEAAGSLGTKPTFRKKNCKLKITNSIAELPCGFKKLHGVRISNEDMGKIENQNSIFAGQFLNPDLIYMERTYLPQCAEEFNTLGVKGIFNPFEGTIEIVGNQIRFPIPCPYTHCIISYDGWATTEDGILEMAAVYERGFSEYAVAKMYETYPQLWNNDWGSREAQIQRSWMDWTAQRAKYISDAFADGYDNNKYMVKRMLNALLQDQNSASIN